MTAESDPQLLTIPPVTHTILGAPLVKPVGSSSWGALAVLTWRFSLPDSTEPNGKTHSPGKRQNSLFTA